MKLVDPSKIELKRGTYGVAPASALEDSSALSRVQGHRRMLRSRMMAMDKARADRKMPAGDYHVSLKVDGEFNGLVFAEGEAFLVNPGGTVRVGLPLLEEAAASLSDAGVKTAIFAGELYVKRGDDKRPRVHDVSRVARKPESDEDVASLCLAVFDIVDLDGVPPMGEFAATWEKIVSLFGGGEHVHPVQSVQVDKPAAVLDQFEDWVEKGGSEGVVARSDSAGMFKIKPLHTMDLAVVGYAEGVDDRAGLLHDLLLAVVRGDGAYQIIGRVGGGFSDDQRRDLLSDLKDRDAESDYAEINSDRVAYQMVTPGMVVEISCLDLISESTRGATIDRMVLEWDAKKGWGAICRLPLASIISPQFLQVRSDKEPGSETTGLAQLSGVIEVPDADRTAADLDLPKSEVISREVAIKVLKGKTMVRKLLLWKTNKEESAENYPAYVALLTDFSPGRKEPLQREIRVSDSREQIDTLHAALKEKFFVRGWKAPGDE